MNKLGYMEHARVAVRYPEKIENIDSLTPIPLGSGSVEGWKTLPIEAVDEPLVPLGPFGEYRAIYTSSIYFGEHNDSPYISPTQQLDGAMATVFVRESVAQRLLEAQEMLPDGQRLIVFDSYRPLKVQASLYDMFSSRLGAKYPDWSSDEIANESQKYVSLPSTDASRPSPHNTGGAVDLGIIELSPRDEMRVREIDHALNEWLHPESDIAYQLEMEKSAILRHGGRLLHFGTPFDHGGASASVDHFEQLEQSGFQLSPEDIVARDNRRLLYTVMTRVGMQPYGPEWWHWNAPETQMGAVTVGLDVASFGAAELSVENIEHERMRSMHHAGAAILQERLLRGDTVVDHSSPLAHYMGLVATTQRLYGDSRLSGLARAERIDEALK